LEASFTARGANCRRVYPVLFHDKAPFIGDGVVPRVGEVIFFLRIASGQGSWKPAQLLDI
jgi:hypothetical protein